MKTIILKSLFLILLFAGLSAHADQQVEAAGTEPVPEHGHESHFSVRIRPMAIAYGILGGEVYYDFTSGYFVGLTANLGSDDNSDKDTSLANDEYGIKLGKFFGKDQSLESGFWTQGALNLNHTSVTSFYSGTQQSLTAIFYQLSVAFTVGYQFRMTFVDPERLNVRLGAGIGYKSNATTRVSASNGSLVPIGVRRRLDPTLEFTLGYLL